MGDMDEETYTLEVTEVPTYDIPCIGGPLNKLKLSEPLPPTIPCSDGVYRLTYQAVYEYEREGRKPVGPRADD